MHSRRVNALLITGAGLCAMTIILVIVAGACGVDPAAVFTPTPTEKAACGVSREKTATATFSPSPTTDELLEWWLDEGGMVAFPVGGKPIVQVFCYIGTSIPSLNCSNPGVNWTEASFDGTKYTCDNSSLDLSSSGQFRYQGVGVCSDASFEYAQDMYVWASAGSTGSKDQLNYDEHDSSPCGEVGDIEAACCFDGMNSSCDDSISGSGSNTDYHYVRRDTAGNCGNYGSCSSISCGDCLEEGRLRIRVYPTTDFVTPVPTPTPMYVTAVAVNATTKAMIAVDDIGKAIGATPTIQVVCNDASVCSWELTPGPLNDGGAYIHHNDVSTDTGWAVLSIESTPVGANYILIDDNRWAGVYSSEVVSSPRIIFNMARPTPSPTPIPSPTPFHVTAVAVNATTQATIVVDDIGKAIGATPASQVVCNGASICSWDLTPGPNLGAYIHHNDVSTDTGWAVLSVKSTPAGANYILVDDNRWAGVYSSEVASSERIIFNMARPTASPTPTPTPTPYQIQVYAEDGNGAAVTVQAILADARDNPEATATKVTKFNSVSEGSWDFMNGTTYEGASIDLASSPDGDDEITSNTTIVRYVTPNPSGYGLVQDSSDRWTYLWETSVISSNQGVEVTFIVTKPANSCISVQNPQGTPQAIAIMGGAVKDSGSYYATPVACGSLLDTEVSDCCINTSEMDSDLCGVYIDFGEMFICGSGTEPCHIIVDQPVNASTSPSEEGLWTSDGTRYYILWDDCTVDRSVVVKVSTVPQTSVTIKSPEGEDILVAEIRARTISETVTLCTDCSSYDGAAGIYDVGADITVEAYWLPVVLKTMDVTTNPAGDVITDTYSAGGKWGWWTGDDDTREVDVEVASPTPTPTNTPRPTILPGWETPMTEYQGTIEALSTEAPRTTVKLDDGEITMDTYWYQVPVTAALRVTSTWQYRYTNSSQFSKAAFVNFDRQLFAGETLSATIGDAGTYTLSFPSLTGTIHTSLGSSPTSLTSYGPVGDYWTTEVVVRTTSSGLPYFYRSVIVSGERVTVSLAYNGLWQIWARWCESGRTGDQPCDIDYIIDLD